MHLCNKPRRKAAGAAPKGDIAENAFISARYLKVSLKDGVSQMLRRDIVRRKKTQTKTHSGLHRRAFEKDHGGPFGLLCSLAGDERDVAAADAEVAQLTVGHAAEFADGLTVLAPVVERACQVHVYTPFLGFVPGGRSSLAPPQSDEPNIGLRREKEQRWNGTAPMRFTHVK
jgi:hypothetical protein